MKDLKYWVVQKSTKRIYARH